MPKSRFLRQAKRLIPALALFLAGPLLSLLVLLPGDRPYYNLYCLAFFLFALLSRPLMKRLFSYAPDGGWLYGQLAGLLLPALSVWILGHMGLPVFSREGLLAAALLWGLVLYVGGSRKVKRKDRLKPRPSQAPLCLAESGLFFLLLLLGTFMRSLKPEAHGLEKFMDYGFMMSMWRSSRLPALDMWLSGHSINYYYFGQYLYTALAKMVNASPAYAYNLSMASSFALSFTLAFALVRDLLSCRASEEIECSDKIRRFSAGLGGLLAGALLCLAGNSHAFFYRSGKLGNKILHFFERSGAELGDLNSFSFSNSTRFIGYNPETTDKTIHEFPYYSYLVADLHAHMVNLSVVLLLLAVLFALYRALRDEDLSLSPDSQSFPFIPEELRKPSFIAAAVLLSISSMANYWDFVIYIVLSFLVLLASFGTRDKTLGGIRGFGLLLVQLLLTFTVFLKIASPVLRLLMFILVSVLCIYIAHFRSTAFTRSGRALALLFTLAELPSLGFNLSFDPMSKELVFTQNRSGFYQLFILWFAHALLALILIAVFFVMKKKDLAFPKDRSPLARLLSQDPSLLFMLILACCGLGLILAPEVIYVRDIYEGSFSRANTMFKFTYQAYSLLSLTAAFTFSILLLSLIAEYETEILSFLRFEDNSEGSKPSSGELKLPRRFRGPKIKDKKRPYPFFRVIMLVISFLLLLIPFQYTSVCKEWYGSPKLSRRQGLEATAYYGRLSFTPPKGESSGLSHRLDVINYFNEYVEGQPNILEAFGMSYSDACSVSAYTGLPTVIGWQTHEWLWRSSSEVRDAYGTVVVPLQNAVTEFYEASYPETMPRFLRRYNISYIVVGEIERARFRNLDEEALLGLGEVVFRSGDDYVIAVR